MKYITSRHPDYNVYYQFDENGEVSALYFFDEEAGAKVLNKVLVMNMPEFFLLPFIKDEKGFFNEDYCVNCACFKDFDEVAVVTPGCNIRFVNNNKSNLVLVLEEEQALYGVIDNQKGRVLPSEQHCGSLIVLNKNFQDEEQKQYAVGSIANKTEFCVSKLGYGFESAPEYGANRRVVVDRYLVYDRDKNDLVATPLKADESANQA